MLVADYLIRAAQLNTEKHGAYGENHERLGLLMTALFPHGVTLATPNDHERFAVLILMGVKLTRYAVAWDNPDKDHARDLTVYSAMLEALDDHRSGNGCGSNQQPESDAPVENRASSVDAVLGSRSFSHPWHPPLDER
jgi:hypothetical protein